MDCKNPVWVLPSSPLVYSGTASLNAARYLRGNRGATARARGYVPGTMPTRGFCNEESVGLASTGEKCLFASIGRRLKSCFAHCEKFLTVGESAWHWPLRKKS